LHHLERGINDEAAQEQRQQRNAATLNLGSPAGHGKWLRPDPSLNITSGMSTQFKMPVTNRPMAGPLTCSLTPLIAGAAFGCDPPFCGWTHSVILRPDRP